jgi:hypothetical protein
MTDTGGEVPRTEDPGPEGARGTDVAGDQGSRLEESRKRIAERASALRDGVEKHAPPAVLSGLAAAARNVALYLDGMAERARVKQAKEEAPLPEPTEQVPKPAEQVPEPTEQVPEPTEQADSASKD